jgi:hypothetical protein
MGGTGKAHLPVQTRPALVDVSPLRQQRPPIFSPIETAYFHCDNSDYGWGVVLNEQLEARGLWPAVD